MSNTGTSSGTQTAWLSLNLHHAFAEFHLSAQLDLHRPWTVLFGPSGSGKTTILRAIAGLFTPDSGQITLQSETLFSRDADHSCIVNTVPQSRRVGLVTQTPALFPHLTAAENVAFALRGLPYSERNKKVQSLLQIFAAETLCDRYPKQLSGGQQQRIALARTLAAEPRLLLLDEPFSAMDQASRQQVLHSLQQWTSQRAVPVLMVTHNLAECFLASDEVAVIEHGAIVAQGAAQLVLQAARAQLLTDLQVTHPDSSLLNP